MSDGVLATDPAAAAALVADLRAAAHQIDGTTVADPGGDAAFGAAASALAGISSASARWRGACADVLIALATGTTVAVGETTAADSW